MTRLGMLLAGLVVALPLAAQQPPIPLRFEVASIRQNVSGSGSSSLNFNGQTFTTVNVPFFGLMQFAYEITAAQIDGGPDWVRTDRFDIVAKMASDGTRDQIALMLRALLEERFKLRLRNEMREMAILELGLANSDGRVGPNLQDCSKKDVSPAERSFTAPRGGDVAAGFCGPVSRIAGLVGPDLPNPNSANPDLPSFVTALREQLGLRLDRTRGPVEVLVIDSVERPTPN